MIKMSIGKLFMWEVTTVDIPLWGDIALICIYVGMLVSYCVCVQSFNFAYFFKNHCKLSNPLQCLSFECIISQIIFNIIEFNYMYMIMYTTLLKFHVSENSRAQQTKEV